MIDVLLDQVVQFLEQVVRRDLTVLDQVEEVVAVARVVLCRGPDRQ